ncbi:hypothetical protein H8S95_06290 [Pontibacter sp. KCTC 32443]|uniref:hypothetical protein n=1 Tax=Pontibacter deserti TaxID=1343896 RepID=UPI00199CAF38|nr:hypothetical protein [Pontibacter deserti]MBC5773664.1 hypothetical protein [Pontibacter sp. KCTC 32443]
MVLLQLIHKSPLALAMLLAFTLISSQAFAQQLIYTGKDLSNKFYLYKGDKLRIEYAGPVKKMKVFFNGASDPAASYEDYNKRAVKLENIEQSEWVITKEGLHKISVTQEKGDYDLKLFRYPAPGKEKAPLTYTKKYSFAYEPTDFKADGFTTSYKKVLTSKLVWDNVDAECYVPGDEGLIDHSINKFNAKKGIILYDDTYKTGPIVAGDKVLSNQLPFALQAGDTLTFEIKYDAPASSGSTFGRAWIARYDQHYAFDPETGSMPDFILNTGMIKASTPSSHSIVAGADGMFSFFFNGSGTFTVKVVRHPGKNNNPKFRIPYDMVPVKREGTLLYFIEPKLK